MSKRPQYKLLSHGTGYQYFQCYHTKNYFFADGSFLVGKAANFLADYFQYFFSKQWVARISIKQYPRLLPNQLCYRWPENVGVTK